MCHAKHKFRTVKMDWWESNIMFFIISSGRYLDNLNNMPTDFDIFRAITSTWCLNVRCLSKIIPKNLILFVSCIVEDPILILVKCNSFLYEKIIYFIMSALIQKRFDVSQLLTLLSAPINIFHLHEHQYSSVFIFFLYLYSMQVFRVSIYL